MHEHDGSGCIDCDCLASPLNSSPCTCPEAYRIADSVLLPISPKTPEEKMPVTVDKKVVTTVTITMDTVTAFCLRQFLDPDHPYIHISNNESLQKLLAALKETTL